MYSFDEAIAHSDQLIVKGYQPFNAEPCAAALVGFPLTPEELAYCRNHGPVRKIQADDFYITVSGGVERELKLSVPELQLIFPAAEVVAAMQVGRACFPY
jgi:sulfite oxidase